jgi:hypothetical protein
MDINYIIFDYSEIDKIDFEQVLETSIDTIKLSLDGTKTFVKWIGETPSFISSLDSKSIIYNNEEMLIILSQVEWNNYTPILESVIN